MAIIGKSEMMATGNYALESRTGSLGGKADIFGGWYGAALVGAEFRPWFHDHQSWSGWGRMGRGG
jgi:hypothetical protein